MSRTKKTMVELTRLSPTEYQQVAKQPISILLDDIRSANNVGSIFRTADCLAIAHVYLCGITAQPPHRDILKTALGATQSVSWSYHEDAVALTQVLRSRGKAVYALEQAHGSAPLRGFEPPEDVVIIVGNEVDGVQQELIDLSDGAIEIEQFGTKHSLNVAVAAGLVLWELSRGRR